LERPSSSSFRPIKMK